MKRTLLNLVALFATISTAEAQCYYVAPGSVTINHRIGILYGRNFTARVACSWGAPTYVFWRGGVMCSGRWFYGRNFAGRPFSCRVLGFGRR
jgi:hypothetical protein